MRFKKQILAVIGFFILVSMGFGLTSCGGDGGTNTKHYMGVSTGGEFTKFALDGYNFIQDGGVVYSEPMQFYKHDSEYGNYLYGDGVGGQYSFFSNRIGLLYDPMHLKFIVGLNGAYGIPLGSYIFKTSDGNYTTITIPSPCDDDGNCTYGWSDSKGNTGSWEDNGDYITLNDNNGNPIYDVTVRHGSIDGIVVLDINNHKMGIGLESGKSLYKDSIIGKTFSYWYKKVANGDKCYGIMKLKGQSGDDVVGTYKEICMTNLTPSSGDVYIQLGSDSSWESIITLERQGGFSDKYKVFFDTSDGYFMGLDSNGFLMVGSE